MGVLSFDGTNDRLRFATLAAAIANVSNGAWTLAVLLKRGGTGGWDAITYLCSGTGAGVAEAGMSLRGTAPLNALSTDLGGGGSSTSTFTDTTSPYLFVLSKAAGSAVPRLSWKLGSGGSWAREDFSALLVDQIAATFLDIGVWQGTSDPFVGHIGLVAWWEGAMSDANKEVLDANWRTSDWYNSAHGTPAALFELNVAAGSVVDLIGNATGLAAESGGDYPTLDAGQTLDSWNFNGTGAAGGVSLTPTAGSTTITGQTPGRVLGTVLTPTTP